MDPLGSYWMSKSDNSTAQRTILPATSGFWSTFWMGRFVITTTFLECICARGDFLSHHARGSPLGMALSWVVSVPGSPSGGMGTSRVRLPPTGTRTMALKPPFSYLHYCSEALRHLTVSPPPRSFPPMRIGGRHRRCLNLGDAYTWRHLILATPHLGEASSWRRLVLATPTLGDALSGQPVDFLPLGPLRGPTICWLWLWSTPGDGMVQLL